MPLALALVLAVLAQDAPPPLVREDRELWSDAIWGYGGIGGPKSEQEVELPPPIEVGEWLVLPDDAPLTEWQIFTRHLLDPDAPPPRAGEHGWQERAARVVEHARAAFATVRVEQDDVRMADLDGAELLFVNGEGFLGDPERRGYRGIPVAMHAGVNQLLVLAVRGSFSLRIWSPSTRIVLGTWDATFSVEDPDDEQDEVRFPVLNASLEPVHTLHLHYGHATLATGPKRPLVTDWRCAETLLPLGVEMTGSYFRDIFTDRSEGVVAGADAVVPICAWADEDEDADRRPLRGSAPARMRPDPVRSRQALVQAPFARLTRASTLLWCPGPSAMRARIDQQRAWYLARSTPQAFPADAWFDRRQHHPVKDRVLGTDVILYGNEATNTAWETFVGGEPPIRVTRGRLETPDGVIERDDLAGWFLVPRADRPGSGLQTLCIADTGERGARFGQWLRSLTSPAPEPDLDWAFFAPGPDGPELVTSGRFAR